MHTRKKENAKQEEARPGIDALLGGGSRDLLPAIELGGNAKESDRTYIIYYANETDAKSVNRISDWLAASDDAGQRASAKQLRGDAKTFPEVVEDEIAELRKGASVDPKLGLIVFTNSLARRGVFELMDCEAQKSSQIKWPVVKSQLNVFATHPLAHPKSLGTALKAIAKQIGESKMADSDFVLIAKSHGTSELAIAQGYAPLHQADSQSELLQIIADLKAAAEQTKSTGKIVKSEQQMSFDRRLNREQTLTYVGDDTLTIADMGSTLAAGDTTSTLAAGAGVSDNTLGVGADVSTLQVQTFYSWCGGCYCITQLWGFPMEMPPNFFALAHPSISLCKPLCRPANLACTSTRSF